MTAIRNETKEESTRCSAKHVLDPEWNIGPISRCCFFQYNQPKAKNHGELFRSLGSGLRSIQLATIGLLLSQLNEETGYDVTGRGRV